jgi:hypothetical protein
VKRKGEGKTGAVVKNVGAGDGVCGPAVAVSGGLGVVGGDLWWLGGFVSRGELTA